MTDGEAAAAPRYALYWAPPAGGALWRFGATWLGRDAETGVESDPPGVPGCCGANARRITEEPRRYGFHATLKPPFRLAAGRIEEELTAACSALAAAEPAVDAPPLVLRRLGGFLALVPEGTAAGIDRLAARAVIGLDAFRAPAPPAELAQRRRHGLSSRQEGYLSTWGYPYVLEEFRFHLTLTGRLAADEIAAVESGLRPLTAGFAEPFRLHELALFVEPAPRAPFRLLRRFPLGG